MLYDKKWSQNQGLVDQSGNGFDLAPPPRKFLTAQQLRIPKWMRSALIEVLRRLEAGELQYVRKWKTSHVPNGFNMACWWTDRRMLWSCGTVGCIGGWAEHIAGRADWMLNHCAPTKALEDLMYPELSNKAYARMTVPRTAQALSNYLTTGESKWKEVLA